MYRESRNYHNQQNAIFPGVGAYDIPQIRPEDVDLDGLRWVPFNAARTTKDPEDAVCHCFVDDYQFERLWHDPAKYLNILRRFRAVCSPDFSLYTDFPKAIQIYNHFRKHWLAKYYQDNGVTIIPTIGWSDKSSYEWCFDGEPRNGVVAICDAGCNSSQEVKDLFQSGYDKMIETLEPSRIYMYTYNGMKDRVNGEVYLVDNSIIKNMRRKRDDGRKR